MKQELTCLRCGYEWERKTTGRLPKQCPSCKSMRWGTERRPKGRPRLNTEPVTVTVNTVPDAQAEEKQAVVMVEDVPMVMHGNECSCTNCLWQRGEL